MRRLRLLLGLALLTWAGVNAASKCEEQCKDQKLKGFHRERPKCECGSGSYQTCTNGAYYAHTPTMCIYASREEAEKFCAKRDSSGFLAFVEDWDESYHIARTSRDLLVPRRLVLTSKQTLSFRPRLERP